MKARLSRSMALGPSLAEIVVRTPALPTPPNPGTFLGRPTEPGEASCTVRWISAVIFRQPWIPSAVSRRSPANGPSASTVHAASRTACIAIASLTVR